MSYESLSNRPVVSSVFEPTAGVSGHCLRSDGVHPGKDSCRIVTLGGWSPAGTPVHIRP